jgi:Arc/MetJ family transcription regulator
MKAQIDIDENLLREAMEATGLASTQEVVQAALEKVVRIERQVAAIKALKGSIDYDPVTGTWTAREPAEPQP